MVTTDLRFLGEWTLWAALGVAFTLGVVAWFYYRRETRSRTDWLRWMLPTLRALVVMLIVLMLAGPVLHHRQVIGQLAHLMIFVDASQSMSVTDEHLSPVRKMLAARQLGWITNDKSDPSLREAVELMGRAVQQAAEARVELENKDLNETSRRLASDVAQVVESLGKVRPATWNGASSAATKLRAELLDPAQKLGAREIGNDPKKFVTEMQALGRVAARWDGELQQAFADHLARFAQEGDSSVSAAFRKLDTMPRWNRMESLLFDGEKSLFNQLASSHNVELIALTGAKGEVLWRPDGGDMHDAHKPPDKFMMGPTNSVSDLNSAVKARLEGAKDDERMAVVLLSDGQHNSGTSPLQLAKMLGNRGVQMFTVGYGSEQPPPDLGILSVQSPETVFQEASIKGEIELKDDMPGGKQFMVRIERNGRVVWEKSFLTEQRSPRKVAFDFSVKDMVKEELKRQDKQLKIGALPLNFTVTTSAVEGEKDRNNNTNSFRVSAITEKPKVLVVDGRPRWEFRYLKNLFERDDRWQANVLLAGAGGEERQWPRGKQVGQYPVDRETLFDYQLIIFGDVPAAMLRPADLDALREFVEKRGGGIIFVDGRQTPLATYGRTTLGSLLPVDWKGQPIIGNNVKLNLASAASGQGAFSFLTEERDNAQLWGRLPGPHWVAPAVALPGTEVLLEAQAGGRTVPAAIYRRFGAGRVLYLAFDESWRWRYDVGDLYHQKFWNQACKWIMEPAFPVQDKFVALDSGPLNYAPGDTAEIRVRLRDSEGRLLLKAKAEAWLMRDGRKVAAIALEPDENSAGIFRGRTAPLTEGLYEVQVHVDGLPENEMKARTELVVAPPGAPEMVQINCNEDLLKQLAFNSGGAYFREEEAARIVERLRPLSQGKVIESETVLWNSWWWFVPIVFLLTVEWTLRKRAGML